MSIFAFEIREPRARAVRVSGESRRVDLADGRSLSVPLNWYPRLWHGSPRERSNVEILGDGAYIHWPDLDEDLTVAGLLEGRRSAEGLASLKKWLATRRPARSKAARKLKK